MHHASHTPCLRLPTRVQALEAFGGRLDVLLLNHAAFQYSFMFEAESAAALAAEANRILQPNVVGTVVAAWAAMPALAASGGRLAVTSSGGAYVIPPSLGFYGGRCVSLPSGSAFWLCILPLPPPLTPGGASKPQQGSVEPCV